MKQRWQRAAAQLTSKRIPLPHKVVPLLAELNSKHLRIVGYLPNVIYYEKRNASHAWVGEKIEQWFKKHFERRLKAPRSGSEKGFKKASRRGSNKKHKR